MDPIAALANTERASTPLDANNLAAAESVYVEALDIQKRVLGRDHIDVSYTMNNLAFVFLARGQPDSAEALFRQSLAIRRKALGLHHPEYAAALSNLGALLLTRGSLDEAEAVSKEGCMQFSVLRPARRVSGALLLLLHWDV